MIIGAHKRITENLFKELIKAKISQVRSALADLEGAYSVADVVNRQTGEVLLEANKPLTRRTVAGVCRIAASPKSTCSSRSATTSAWCFRARSTRTASALRRKR